MNNMKRWAEVDWGGGRDWRPETGGRRAEVGGRRSPARSLGQLPGVRSPKSEVRRSRPETGDRRLATGGWLIGAGGWAWRGLRLAVLLGLLAGLIGPRAAAQSWSERARRLNSREISAADAQTRSAEERREQRNHLSMRRIQPAMPSVDWDADPTAIPYMLYQVNKRTDLPVHIDNDGLNLATDELFEHLVIYLTSHNHWSLNEKEIDNLQRWLNRGGTLLLDDCYNRGSAFADAVPVEVGRLIPGAQAELLLAEDPLVKDVFRLGYDTPWPGTIHGIENRPWQYFLLDDRPAVFFTPNDDGCGWEVSTPPTASNPIGEGIGHGGDNATRELFYQWATSWMLFVYMH